MIGQIRAYCRSSVVVQKVVLYLHLVRLAGFRTWPDDLFIVTYPRSGTTWMQMILYQLTTDGSMDFKHINHVSPWFEMAPLSKKAYARLPRPRLLKSHLRYRAIPKGDGRYIYIARDGRDVLVSYYHLYSTTFHFKGTFADFFEMFMAGNVFFGSWFDHVADWHARKDDPHVLFLRYEDLIADLEGNLKKIIHFAELKVGADQMPRIIERSGFAFMKQYQEKFGPPRQPESKTPQTACGRHSTFIRKGKAGGWRELLTEEQNQRFQETLARTIPGVY